MPITRAYAKAGSPLQGLANPVINGGMDIWQRGTSVVGSTTAFAADRWQAYRAAAGSTYSRQTTSDTTNLPNIQYCLRAQRDSGSTSTTIIDLWQAFETVNTIPFVGKTITLSFYARKGANFSAGSSNLNVVLGTGTGTDQNPTGYTGSATPINSTATLTTTWQRFAFTATLATTANEMYTEFYYTPVGTAGAADYFEVTGVQIDLGTYTAATAPEFRRSGGTLAGELAACQRYYSKSARTGTAPAEGLDFNTDCIYNSNSTHSTSGMLTQFYSFPQTMRTTPTMTFYRSSLTATNARWGYYNGTWVAATTTSTSTLTDKGFSANMDGTYTANNSYPIAGGWAASAEL